jgi:hypothetical protein
MRDEVPTPTHRHDAADVGPQHELGPIALLGGTGDRTNCVVLGDAPGARSWNCSRAADGSQNLDN